MSEQTIVASTRRDELSHCVKFLTIKALSSIYAVILKRGVIPGGVISFSNDMLTYSFESAQFDYDPLGVPRTICISGITSDDPQFLDSSWLATVYPRILQLYQSSDPIYFAHRPTVGPASRSRVALWLTAFDSRVLLRGDFMYGAAPRSAPAWFSIDLVSIDDA